MKLLVFAHTPPPHHGQSQMVQVLVEGFGGDCRRQRSPAQPAAADRHGIQLVHVNVRLSDGLDDVGTARGGKLLPLLKYCAQAIWGRLRWGANTLYYIPAPARRAPLCRDWIVMTLCRPWFRRVILHWHAVGLGDWVESSAKPWERWLTRRTLGRAHLSLVLAEFVRPDAERLRPRRTAVVANGIADPCPQCEYELLPWRQVRRRRLAKILDGTSLVSAPAESPSSEIETARVLFMAHATREKGLFDAVDAVARANAALAARSAALRFELIVAGEFREDTERAQFDQLRVTHSGWLRYAGFVRGEGKEALFRTADVFLFPTFYPNEGQPVALIEAMAYGLPIVTTRWRAIPEALPAGYSGLVEPHRADQAAEALLRALAEDGAALRTQFTRRFTVEKHLETLAAAIHSLSADLARRAGAKPPAAPAPGDARG